MGVQRDEALCPESVNLQTHVNTCRTPGATPSTTPPPDNMTHSTGLRIRYVSLVSLIGDKDLLLQFALLDYKEMCMFLISLLIFILLLISIQTLSLLSKTFNFFIDLQELFT